MSKRLILSFQCLFGVLLLTSPAYAFKFPWDALKPELNAVKVEMGKNAESIADVKVDVGQNMKALAALDLRVGNIDAKLNAQGAAVAGFKNDVSNLSSGRDTVQTTTNSDSVVIQMLNTYKYIIGLLIAQLVGLVIQMIVLVKYIASLFQAQIIEKDKMIERERTSRDDKDQKADEWKERYIESVTGHKTGEVKQ